MWLSLVERCVRDAEAAGSNPVIPTYETAWKQAVFCIFRRVQICFFSIDHDCATIKITYQKGEGS